MKIIDPLPDFPVGLDSSADTMLYPYCFFNKQLRKKVWPDYNLSPSFMLPRRIAFLTSGW